MAPESEYAPFLESEKFDDRSSSSEDSRVYLGPDNEQGDPLVRRKRTLRKRQHWAAHFISLCTIVGLTIALVHSLMLTRAKCWDMFNYYSPVNDAVVPHPYVHRQFNGSLWHQTPFTGPPTPEVEQAWYEVMKYGLISVSKSDIEKIQHEEWYAQFPAEAGGGYIAATIGTHQIHCLHYIWQDHYMDYLPKVQAKKNMVPELYNRHYEHCMDYVRQSLMCQFDTGIMPYNWVLDHQNPTPNGNTHHKCVDWDRLQDWLESRKVEMPEGFEWRQPDDATRLGWNP